MSRLRILVLAPDTDPESICGPLVSYCHAEALAGLHDVTLVIRAGKEEAVRRARGPFGAIEAIRLPWLESVFAWCLRWIFKNSYTSQVLTAFSYPFSIAFEWKAWRRLRARIMAGEFDVVLRLMPIVAVLPSPFAFFLRMGPIPFVVGPINGGLPWPQGFSQADNQKEWISRLRNLYRFLPFSRSTYRNAAAIMAASSQTYAEFAQYREKLFFVPENGISRSLCSHSATVSDRNGKLQLIFAGALVPCKALDLGLRAAAPLLRKGLASFTVVGDGPERSRLEHLTKSLGIDAAVSFCGFLSHEDTLKRLQSADVLVFPSVRDFGGGVVFEALAAGAVPIVADYGGPGDIVHSEVGRKVQLTNEHDVTSQLEKILFSFAQQRDLVDRLREQGICYAHGRLSWEAKAESVTHILKWVLRQGPKPDLPPPKLLRNLTTDQTMTSVTSA
jgi:glycosyltransferase involved in cell wall biosynthesis